MSDRAVVKQTDYAVLYSDGTILVKDVRFAYPHVFEPYKGDDKDAKAKFGVVGLMPKTKDRMPAMRLIRDYVNELIVENKLKSLPVANKFIRDGDESGKDEFAGCFTINASEIRRPIVRGNKRDPKTKRAIPLVAGKDDDVIYGGCWGSILIRPWFQNNKFGKKVNAGLSAVQFLRDDEAFGLGRVSEDDVDETFDEFSDEESGFDDDLGEDDEL